MAYATYQDVEAGYRDLTTDEEAIATELLDEAAIIIDTLVGTDGIEDLSDGVLKLVSCRMVRRALGDGEGSSFPLGATQGSMSAGGYSQSWTLSTGSSGELYLSRVERKMLGIGNNIGSYSPVQELTR